MADDDDEIEESSSPGEHPIPGGRNVANIPVNEWTGPEYWAFRQEDPYVAAPKMVLIRGSAISISTECSMRY